MSLNANSVVLDPSSYEQIISDSFIVFLVSLVFCIGTIVWMMCSLPYWQSALICILGAFIAVFLFTIIAQSSLQDMPFLGNCKDLAADTDISIRDCMSVVKLGESYTGQEIVDLVGLKESSVPILEQKILPCG